MEFNIIIGYFCVMIFSLFASLGAVFLKFYSQTNKIKHLYLAFLSYFLNILIMIITMIFFDLIVVFNISSLVYVFSLYFGFFIFKEKLTKYKILGVVLIFLGGILISF